MLCRKFYGVCRNIYADNSARRVGQSQHHTGRQRGGYPRQLQGQDSIEEHVHSPQHNLITPAVFPRSFCILLTNLPELLRSGHELCLHVLKQQPGELVNQVTNPRGVLRGGICVARLVDAGVVQKKFHRRPMEAWFPFCNT